MALRFARSFLLAAIAVILAAPLGDCQSACDIPCITDVIDVTCAEVLCGYNANSPDRVDLVCRPACVEALNGKSLKKCLSDETIPRPRRGLIMNALKGLVIRTCRTSPRPMGPGQAGEKKIPESTMRLLTRLGFFPEDVDEFADDFQEDIDSDDDDSVEVVDDSDEAVEVVDDSDEAVEEVDDSEEVIDDFEEEGTAEGEMILPDPEPYVPYEAANATWNETTWEPAYPVNATWNETTWGPYHPVNASWNESTWEPYHPAPGTWNGSTWEPYHQVNATWNETTWGPYHPAHATWNETTPLPYGAANSTWNETTWDPLANPTAWEPVTNSTWNATGEWNTTWDPVTKPPAGAGIFWMNETETYEPMDEGQGSSGEMMYPPGETEYSPGEMEDSPVVLPIPGAEEEMPAVEIVDVLAEEPVSEEVVEGPASEEEGMITVILENFD